MFQLILRLQIKFKFHSGKFKFVLFGFDYLTLQMNMYASTPFNCLITCGLRLDFWFLFIRLDIWVKDFKVDTIFICRVKIKLQKKHEKNVHDINLTFLTYVMLYFVLVWINNVDKRVKYIIVDNNMTGKSTNS